MIKQKITTMEIIVYPNLGIIDIVEVDENGNVSVSTAQPQKSDTELQNGR